MNELNAALDQVLIERRKNAQLLQKVSNRDRAVAELSTQLDECKRRLTTIEECAIDSHRRQENEIKSLRSALAARETELVVYSTAVPRDIAVLEEKLRASLEKPLLERIEEAELRADESKKEASASSREVMILQARIETSSSAAVREAAMAAEAHEAKVASLQAKLLESGLLADEAAAAHYKEIQNARESAALAAARASEAERESLVLRQELETLRVAYNRESVARVREVAEAKTAADAAYNLRIISERSSEAARAEALALGTSLNSLSTRLAEATVSRGRFSFC